MTVIKQLVLVLQYASSLTNLSQIIAYAIVRREQKVLISVPSVSQKVASQQCFEASSYSVLQDSPIVGGALLPSQDVRKVYLKVNNGKHVLSEILILIAEAPLLTCQHVYKEIRAIQCSNAVLKGRLTLRVIANYIQDLT